MKHLVLLTRDCGNCDFTKERLARDNIDSYIHPIANIIYRDVQISADLVRDKAVIITSFHGIKNLGDKIELLRDTKYLFIVGKKTEQLLKEYGLNYQMFDSASEMLDYLKNSFDDRKQNFLYLRGEEVSVEFKEDLEILGHSYREEVIYKVNYQDSLSEDLRDKIISKQITEHLAFSKMNALHLLDLLQKNEILDAARNIKIYALSKRIAEPFIKEGFVYVKYPNKPIFEDLLELCLVSL